MNQCPLIDVNHLEVHEEPISAGQCASMTKVLDFLSLGSWRDATEDILRTNGVTHVLSVARETQDDQLLASHFICKRINMEDNQDENLFDHIFDAHSFIENVRETSGHVFVHCRRGISRSPAVVVSYIMRHKQFDYHDAFEFVKSKRGCVSLNLAFRASLEGWQPSPFVSSRSCLEVDPPTEATSSTDSLPIDMET